MTFSCEELHLHIAEIMPASGNGESGLLRMAGATICWICNSARAGLAKSGQPAISIGSEAECVDQSRLRIALRGPQQQAGLHSAPACVRMRATWHRKHSVFRT